MPKFNLESVSARRNITLVEERVIPMGAVKLNDAFRKRVIARISPDSFDVFHRPVVTTITVMHTVFRGSYGAPTRSRTVFTFPTLFQARAFFKWAWQRDLTSFTVECYDTVERKRLARHTRAARTRKKR